VANLETMYGPPQFIRRENVIRTSSREIRMTVSELHAKLTELGFDVPIVILTTVLKAGWDPAVPVPITSTWTKDKTEQVAWLCFLAAGSRMTVSA
jgi:hypothetical protein